MKHASKQAKRGIFAAVVAFLIIVIAFEAASLFKRPSVSVGEESLKDYAQRIVKACADSKYRPTCYDDEIPKLMEKLTMEDAFRVTRAVQDIDHGYQYCHVLGHKLSARETAKDPDQWQTVIQRCPSGLCSNGCIHGAFQERFRKESLTSEELAAFKPQFANVCEVRPGFSPTGLEQGSCYHALGHLFMYVTDADIDRSISLCKELTIKGTRDWSQLCFDGAFMQIYQPLEPDDFTLIEGKEVDRAHVKGFCDGYSGQEQGSCWSEAWPLFREELEKDPNELIRHCSYLPEGRERIRCFNALMYVLTAQMGFDDSRILPYCTALPAGYRGNCFAQAASRLIETDYRNSQHSADLCTKAQPYDKDNLCFKELLKYSTFNFRAGSDAFNAFCSAMPSPWKEKCLEGYVPPAEDMSSKRIAE